VIMFTCCVVQATDGFSDLAVIECGGCLSLGMSKIMK
jgi:hypothetical protein